MLPFYQHEWLFLVKGRWIVILYKPFTNMKIFCLITCLTLFPSIYLISFIGGNIRCIPLILLYLDRTSFTAPLSCEREKIDDNNRFIIKFYIFTLRTTHQPFVYFPFLNFLSSSRVEAIISTVLFIQSYFHNRYRIISS